jgi:ADP-L-glycero-D-manno-heptose 6-epimerase
MIIVTGGAGFIGSNLVAGLNKLGISDILIVDNLTRAEKFNNLVPLKFADFRDKEDFLVALKTGQYQGQKIEAIFHQGACTDTMEYNGRYMMGNNYEYSRILLDFCLAAGIPFIYASSAAVYGSGLSGYREEESCEYPLNVYGFSKLLFDRHVRTVLPSSRSQVVGIRYFNVFGPHEEHKGKMASMTFQLYQQWRNGGVLRLFQGVDGYADGEQKRDFVYVHDVARVNLFFFQNQNKKGIFNCGTGKARTFNSLAQAIVATKGSGKIDFIEFPEVLRGKYQNFTEADLGKLRGMGYEGEFTNLEDAVYQYCQYLADSENV